MGRDYSIRPTAVTTNANILKLSRAKVYFLFILMYNEDPWLWKGPLCPLILSYSGPEIPPLDGS